MISNILIPFDTYERNKKTSSFIGKGDTVLDVGGGVAGLKQFTDANVTTLDLDVGDIKMDARNLKLPEGSFDVVTCVDVLEHVPKSDRNGLVGDLIKLARKKVIISTPYGSSEHEKAEKELLSYLKGKGMQVDYLKEHVANGLPRPRELKKTIPKGAKYLYSGDYRLVQGLFKLHVYEVKNPYINRLIYSFKQLLNPILNLTLYNFWFYENEKKHTNRFYVIIEK